MYELIEALSCHQSVSRLESREQYYEFILSTFRLSSACNEDIIAERFGKQLGQCLQNVAVLLYEHYCSFPYQISHNESSVKLIQATLKMLNLKEIPLEDELKITDAGVPDMEVKGVRHVNTMATLTEKELKDVQSVLDSYNMSLRLDENQYKDDSSKEGLKEMETVIIESVDEIQTNNESYCKLPETNDVGDIKILSTAGSEERSCSEGNGNSVDRAAATHLSDIQKSSLSMTDHIGSPVLGTRNEKALHLIM